MAENITILSEKDFDSKTEKGNWVIDFWASWCGPCKIMAPHFEKAAGKFNGKVNFAKVNVEENYNLSDKFKIMSIPTMLMIKDGEIVNSSVGALDTEAIIEQVENTF